MKRLLIALAVFSALLVGGIGLASYLHTSADPGVEMCKHIRDAQPGGGNDPLTAAEYQQIRDVMESSQDEDLRYAGTRLIDTVWQMNNMDEQKVGFEAVVLAEQLFDAYTDYSGICARHGVILPPFTDLGKR